MNATPIGRVIVEIDGEEEGSAIVTEDLIGSLAKIFPGGVEFSVEAREGGGVRLVQKLDLSLGDRRGPLVVEHSP